MFHFLSSFFAFLYQCPKRISIVPDFPFRLWKNGFGKSRECRWSKALRDGRVFHALLAWMVENPPGFYAVMRWKILGISTVSTWFSTEKALILLAKTHQCGKLDVEIPLHNEFSTYGTSVENHGLFVENSRKKL
ncbi:MAG: hypothetical protein PUE14_07005 [Clostridia bacterium]|nr:hypothetical protein [Clostridia bacterium]